MTSPHGEFYRSRHASFFRSLHGARDPGESLGRPFVPGLYVIATTTTGGVQRIQLLGFAENSFSLIDVIDFAPNTFAQSGALAGNVGRALILGFSSGGSSPAPILIKAVGARLVWAADVRYVGPGTIGLNDADVYAQRSGLNLNIYQGFVSGEHKFRPLGIDANGVADWIGAFTAVPVPLQGNGEPEPNIGLVNMAGHGALPTAIWSRPILATGRLQYWVGEVPITVNYRPVYTLGAHHYGLRTDSEGAPLGFRTYIGNPNSSNTFRDFPTTFTGSGHTAQTAFFMSDFARFA